MLKSKDLLGLKELSAGDIIEILDLAREMKQAIVSGKELDCLKGKSVVTLFYENSTRTKHSFDMAARLLGARTLTLAASTSSVSKGESLVDTGKNLEALLADIIVIRHSMAGAPRLLANNINSSVINAGDGANEHPTQGLLDIFTMREKFGTLENLNIALVGDIKHSRVARSNIWALNKFNANITVVAPYTLLPAGIEQLECKISNDLEKAVKDADVVMGLRLQLERQKNGLFPSISEYSQEYGITHEKIRAIKPDAIVMHPGPINRGVEISSQLAYSSNSVIIEQARNGVAVRMAIMKLLGEVQ